MLIPAVGVPDAASLVREEREVALGALVGVVPLVPALQSE
jgi:hypothetical protein